ncbi:MAG: hypothetical protein FWC51_03320 [Proteobacteria bacterium]|nr:hypothetical protein [Pseudomonadota bacterium]
MEKQDIRTFGRIHGKKLSPRQQWLVENLLPKLAPNQFPSCGGVARSAGVVFECECSEKDHPVGFADTPPQEGNYILEIGFGAGEHLLYLAETFPDHEIIGAEPFMNGVASLLSRMTDNVGAHTCAPGREYAPLQTSNTGKNYKVKPEYRNIRIWPDDVRKLLWAMGYGLWADFRFAKIYILHPDPWPKARHEKRRLLSAEFLNSLADKLTPDGQLIIGTDHTDYFNWVLENVKNPMCKLKIKNDDFTTPPDGGLDTRYMRKNKFGSDRPMYLVLKRADII